MWCMNRHQKTTDNSRSKYASISIHASTYTRSQFIFILARWQTCTPCVADIDANSPPSKMLRRFIWRTNGHNAHSPWSVLSMPEDQESPSWSIRGTHRHSTVPGRGCPWFDWSWTIRRKPEIGGRIYLHILPQDPKATYQQVIPSATPKVIQTPKTKTSTFLPL
jgi:hypothetical protein